MVIDNKYEIGDEVYLKTDPNQYMRLVTAIIVNPSGLVYELSMGQEESRHYDFEMTTEANILKKITDA